MSIKKIDIVKLRKKIFELEQDIFSWEDGVKNSYINFLKIQEKYISKTRILDQLKNIELKESSKIKKKEVKKYDKK